MKCPLLAIGYLAFGDPEPSRKCECMKAVCSWWNEIYGKCVAVSLSDAIAHLSMATWAANKMKELNP